MTNQEAIAQLKEINREAHIYSEAVDMAIKALEAQEWVPSAQTESDNDTEFWRNRAKEYEKMVGELIADMSRGVKFESVEFNENGIVFKKQTERMTNKGWIDLLSKEFNVSRTSARDMLHAIMNIKRYDNFKRTFDPLPKPYREEDTNVNVKS